MPLLVGHFRGGKTHLRSGAFVCFLEAQGGKALTHTHTQTKTHVARDGKEVGAGEGRSEC